MLHRQDRKVKKKINPTYLSIANNICSIVIYCFRNSEID